MRVPFISHSVKTKLKGQAKSLRQRYVRFAHGYDRQGLESLLRRVGIVAGDVILVHSSYDSFEGFRGKATDIILALQAVVGSQGTILMPTIPFSGSALEYVKGVKEFDVERTPSHMGLISEIFRRTPGVLRSIHPTHSVAGWGAHANGLLHDHHQAETPCGQRSPYARLKEYGGKILLLGTGIESMTFFHSLEEELESVMPFSPFTRETYSLRSRDRSGLVLETRTRLFDPLVSRRRNLPKLVPLLKERGVWREAHVGHLQSILLTARDVADCCWLLAKEGVFLYD